MTEFEAIAAVAGWSETHKRSDGYPLPERHESGIRDAAAGHQPRTWASEAQRGVFGPQVGIDIEGHLR